MQRLEILKEYTNYPIITCPDIVLANAEAISLAIREPIVSVVGMGSSGAIITMALLSIRPSWTGVLLKKPGGNECCHRRSVEGNPGWSFNKILVVDDFVSSGRTMEWIVRELGSTKVSYLAAMGGHRQEGKESEAAMAEARYRDEVDRLVGRTAGPVIRDGSEQ